MGKSIVHDLTHSIPFFLSESLFLLKGRKCDQLTFAEDFKQADKRQKPVQRSFIFHSAHQLPGFFSTRIEFASQPDRFKEILKVFEFGMVKETLSIGIWRKKKRDHMHPLLGFLIRENVRQVLTYGKNVTGGELPISVTNVEGSFPFEDATDLDLFVLVELIEEICSPVFLEQKRRVFGLRDTERENFHRLKIAKFYFNI